MATLPLITDTSLLDDLKFMRQIQVAQKRLEREVYDEYDLNREVLEAKVERHFLAHPKHLDVDDSSEESGPRVGKRLKSTWSEKELKLRSRRTKLHEQLTKTEHVTYRAREKRIQHVKHEEQNMTAKAPKNVLTDSEFERKFQVCVDKSLHTINEIRAVMAKGIDPPDGEEDASRRLLRVKEFCNRFSRNYLYPIARQLECLNGTKSSTSISNQKLLAGYQVILNGLQAYLNHLPTSIGGCSADKLKLLLKYLLELCDVHAKRGERGDLQTVQSFRMNAELTLEKIEDLRTASSEDVLRKTTTKANLARKKSGKKTNAAKANAAKANASERLSMYAKTCSFRKDAAWKRTTESFVQKKFNVKSRYKSAIFKQKQPQVQEKGQALPTLSFPSKCKLFPKKSSVIFKKTPLNTPVNEDNIQTMVEVEQQMEVDENKNKLGAGHEELVVRLLRLVLDGSPKGGEEEERAKVSDILEELRKTANKDRIQAILRELEEKKREEELGGRLELKVMESSKARKEPTVTVTGPRNAKLICIRDDNSDDDDIDPEVKDRSNEKFVPLRASSSSHTQTDFDAQRDKSTQRPPTRTSLRRLGGSSRRLRMLPKRFAVAVIQYKLDFHKYCKGIPMYRRSANVQPWLLMSKISDDVLDCALMKVAREIEANDIADRIYRSELQL